MDFFTKKNSWMIQALKNILGGSTSKLFIRLLIKHTHTHTKATKFHKLMLPKNSNMISKTVPHTRKGWNNTQ